MREQLAKFGQTAVQFAIFALIMTMMYPVFKVGGWADHTFGPYWPLSLIVVISTVGLAIAFVHERRQK
ncbi:MAG: hypothetical protein AB7O44_28860 [Hyphomicrobiaceae bacterium]